ncbi:MAG: hypothetical protein Q8R37_05005 [Nanoarchaeota archaeon]|nr:hypothetical protein [Nanoarchaeota archaeon]
MVHKAEEKDKHCCFRCKSCHVDIYKLNGKKYISCLDCGHEMIYSQEKHLNTKI